jgi:hypothetical protein
MAEATSIFDLPTDPVGGGGTNISIQTQELPVSQPSSAAPSSSMSLDQSTINQIVNGLQQATLAGATQLPSRDIPMTTSRLSADPETMPNYVPLPPPKTEDYIQQYHEQHNDMINAYNRKKQIHNSLDEMYNEIQLPILLAVLFFLFQLPIFRKFLYTYLPFLFSNDGNYNLKGFVFTSILFGMLFHFMNKCNGYFGAF